MNTDKMTKINSDQNTTLYDLGNSQNGPTQIWPLQLFVQEHLFWIIPLLWILFTLTIISVIYVFILKPHFCKKQKNEK